jgi:hypothetical protein
MSAIRGREAKMRSIPNWLLHGEEPHSQSNDTTSFTMWGLIAWIAAIVVAADLGYLTQRFLG